MTVQQATPDMLLTFIDVTVRKTSKGWHQLAFAGSYIRSFLDIISE
jgi:hypothetical protein